VVARWKEELVSLAGSYSVPVNGEDATQTVGLQSFGRPFEDEAGECLHWRILKRSAGASCNGDDEGEKDLPHTPNAY